MHLFVSYAHRERSELRSLLDGLRLLGNEVWLDEALTGGQAWWDKILGQIRQCDAFLAVVSLASVESEACNSERQYAAQLKKKIVPVMLRDMSLESLPPDLAVLQVIDFTKSEQEAAFRLAAALADVVPGSALPEPLPLPPPVPLSYLVDISKRVHAHSLTLDEQNAIISQLRTAVRRPEGRDSAVDLIRAFGERPDLYHGPATETEKLLTEAQAATGGSNHTRRWSVGLKEKKKALRRLVVTGRAMHELVWVSIYDSSAVFYKYEERVYLDGNVVRERKSHYPKAEWDFYVGDEGTTFPASIKITWKDVLFWRDKVESFDFIISDEVLYHDDGGQL